MLVLRHAQAIRHALWASFARPAVLRGQILARLARVHHVGLENAGVPIRWRQISIEPRGCVQTRLAYIILYLHTQ
jgi:hypothetical protein